MNDKKIVKRIILGIIIGLLVGSIGSISYAFFTYQKTGAKNSTLILGKVYLNLSEREGIQIENFEPQDTRPDEYYEFSVSGINEADKDVVYDINVLHGNDSTTEGAIRVQDKFVSFTLMKEVGNNNWETIIDSESYDNFEEPLRIYVDKIDANTTSTVTHKYRLYVWLNRDMTIYGGDLTSESGDYSIAEYKKLYTSVKIQVTGDYKEKNYEIPVHTVTFDYNDGVTESTTKRVVYHGHYGNLPTPPEREGYTFMGWNGKNMFNKEKAILDGIRNETPIQSWGKDGINNNWIVSNLFPDVLYTISFDVECTQVPIYDKKYSPGYGYLLLWKDSNNNLWIGNAEYLQVGDRRHIIQQLIIPNSLEGYVIAFYTNRYLYNGSAVLGTMIFSNIQIAEGDTATEYEPYYITSDTKVVQDHDHTLKAIWKENE